MTAISELEDLVDGCVEKFLAQLQHSATSQTGLEVEDWLQYYSFDCLGALSFSEDIGFLSSGHDIDSMIHTVDVIFDYVALVGFEIHER